MKKNIIKDLTNKKSLKVIFWWTCTVVCLIYPIQLFLVPEINTTTLWIFGYKPMMYMVRDTILSLFGVAGAICLAKAVRGGWILISIFSVGILSSWLYQPFVGIGYYESTFWQMTLLLFAILSVIFSNKWKINRPRKRYMYIIIIVLTSIIMRIKS